MGQVFTKEEFELYLEERSKLEGQQKPFKDWLMKTNEEFEAFLTQKFTPRTARKHSRVIGDFIDFITFDVGLLDYGQITKGIANSQFQRWHTSKIGDLSKDELKVATKKFFDFVATEKGMINLNKEFATKPARKMTKPTKMEAQDFVGTWYIQWMEQWDEDYFNMEVQAYITIKNNLRGTFQFGLVVGDMDGKIYGDKYEFTFEGIDENDPVNGSGWIQKKDTKNVKGEFRFHYGDDSTFTASK